MNNNNSQKKRILIVEDDEFLSDAYKSKFEQKFEVEIARDGEEVITKTNSFKPNLIILDMMMPKKDGLQVLKELKQNPESKDIPIIVSSNVDDPQAVKQAKQAGIAKYIVKCNVTIGELMKLCDEFAQ